MLQNTQYDTIMREYGRRQNRNRQQLEEHVREIYLRFPRMQEIDREVSSCSIQKAEALMNGSETGTDDLREKVRQLSRERIDILTSHGYPADYLDMHYDCPLCEDTGYVGNEKCICFKKAAIDLLYSQSNLGEILEKENFEHFSFDYYSATIRNETTGLTAYETAKRAVDKAKLFIQTFDTSFRNLFLYGDTGVGKTFLSHCIARELINSTHWVVYFSAFDLFDLFARNTFGKTTQESQLQEPVFDCDLLIIDDLGTELNNSFVTSQLFLCINERIMRKKSTIISTNLGLNIFKETYSERIFSRILSHYDMISLIGQDIRIQKTLLGGK
ncbi:MAG TPA: ATP-binding protein [Candidatus Blautia gallistercoris]|uniref:ATP-binding protein n=1 Tax=Candidatus Blautia gallistercoris TaxID=2838490 RepID=A0A9D1WFD4_9FIRM|nr:ATP-binding protein [Candidatus Blautia gallistercoris]